MCNHIEVLQNRTKAFKIKCDNVERHTKPSVNTLRNGLRHMCGNGPYIIFTYLPVNRVRGYFTKQIADGQLTGTLCLATKLGDVFI
ncbi:hypothetical protein TNCT_410081 [Trichonephila clavata]|uniref:Uncharacterized protein n=1 Tax=Trichonephila clavata TaxID=2740835 RepID=A0A8X6LLQ1_TRICU|nr:hypothetical protein TNCT_410081 [Trichonephila clavata]